jgi:hypothetical protein
MNYFDIEALSHSRLKAVGTSGDLSHLENAFMRGSAVDALLTNYGAVTGDREVDGKKYTKDQWDNVKRISNALHQDKLIQSLIGHPKVEFQKQVVRDVTFEDWEFYPECTATCKCMHDFYIPGISHDLKVLQVRNQQDAQKRVAELYNTQAYWYMEVSQINTMAFIVVSAINCKIWWFWVQRDDANFLNGKRKIRERLQLWQREGRRLT